MIFYDEPYARKNKRTNRTNDTQASRQNHSIPAGLCDGVYLLRDHFREFICYDKRLVNWMLRWKNKLYSMKSWRLSPNYVIIEKYIIIIRFLGKDKYIWGEHYQLFCVFL